MRAFWIKVINILVICVILFMYQTGARSNEKMSGVIEDLKARLEEKQAEESAPLYKDGTYEGTGKGYKSDIKVGVTVSGGRITEVKILEEGDDPAYLGLASEITEKITEKQGTEGVDTVSGATYSSRGILEAVESALEGASD